MEKDPMLVALAESQEAYLGEIIGRYLEGQAKLRVAAVQIKEYQEAKAKFETQDQQVKIAHETLKAVSSNKEAFEEQNTNLLELVKTVKGQIADLKTTLQLEKEASLRWKEKYELTLPKKKGRPKKAD